MLDVYKAKMPIKQDSNYYYPITTFDQIILPDGSRWDGGTQSDWNVNDAEDPAYVKNRTHWEENNIIHQLDEKYIPDSIARMADVNTPKDFITFKDRSTGILYYGGMDNGNWVTWCDVDHIKVAPAVDNMNYIEGMKLSKEDFIVTAFYIDGSSKRITEYDLIVDEILTLDSTNVEVVFTFNGKSYSDNITFTVVELDPEIKNMLIDFQYDINRNNTYTLTDWYQTYNGNPSTEVIIPDNPNIVL